VGHVVPQAWAMDAFVKLIYDHAGLTAVLPDIGVLALFAAGLCALALRAYARTMYSPG
jgi:ABC-type multidrug transport system permease subunit